MHFTSATHFLQGVRSLLKDGWTQGALARDRSGKVAGATEGSSVCMLGGFERLALQSGQYDLADKARRVVEANLPSGFGNIPSFNDAPSTNLPKVLKVFDAAIANAR